ncbi:PepSY domain-containing protein [Apibacter adventoris]|uniref:FAD-binding oxidoreductase n=1 Tax=Apibacter adventoris TaxID=1679466 RepID=A0A2S8AGC6_9FLAO|nr:PepSY domain-containing protein [Apibacter adventoris]PQL95312.1 FAD-binding oxidoreductase [Apibacter adventoris]
MTLSIWRYAHLTLALISFLFLSMASITGSILAFNAIENNVSPYHIHQIKQISLAQTLPVLQKKYLEITELEITDNSYVKIQGLDKEGNDIEGYINPENGNIIGVPKKNNKFIQWITSFHRSLFLHDTGRIIVGINSFLLFLIATSGSILIIKRQKKITRFFSRIKKSSSPQYYHALFGRLMLLPIIIISVTGTYLTMEKFNLFPKTEHKITSKQSPDPTTKKIDFKDIPLFSQIKLSEVKKIEFPFSEEPDDYYIIKLKDKEITVNQFNGSIVSQIDFPISQKFVNIGLDLHTGRNSIVWAFILIISSLYILFFIYSGFSITWKRKSPKFKNKYTKEESKIILLVGSENGTTFRFAKAVYKQLLEQGLQSYLTELNKYQSFPQAEYLLIFTSTYGLGDAPSNAQKFEILLKKYPQNHPVNYCVIGFGSMLYNNFCGFAEWVDKLLNKELWSKKLINIHKINDKSPVDFIEWVKEWNKIIPIKLYSDTKFYKYIPQGLKKIKVEEVYIPNDSKNTFLIKLKPGKIKFTSGDILVVYPSKENEKERYYSIAKINNNIQLSIKYYPSGLASEYLISRNPGDTIYARVINNTSFHFPEQANQVVLIANGTGIGPFLGMIAQNLKKTKTSLYCGFRQENEIVIKYEQFLEEQINQGKLLQYDFSFSSMREIRYVMDLVKRDKDFFADMLKNNGVIMICGSLQMQTNVEKILDEIVFDKYQERIIEYKNQGQILTDCY